MAQGNFINAEALVQKLNKAFNEHKVAIEQSATALKTLEQQYQKLPSDYIKAQKEIADLMKKQAAAETQLAKVTQEKEKITQQSIRTEQQKLRLSEQQRRASEAQVKVEERKTKQLQAQKSAYQQLSKAEAESSRRVQDIIARGRTAGQTMKQYSQELRIAQEEHRKLHARVVMADAAVGRFNRNVGNYRSAFAGMATGLRSLMSAFGLTSGAMLFAQVMRDAFRITKEFDKANADLAATMGVSRKEMSLLTKDAIRLGGSTKFTATEVSGLQKEFAKLGFSQREILNATEATLALAAAVDTDLANAANIAGSTLRGFGLDASEMARVTDVMAKSFTSSALNIDNFRESMKYVAPIAKAAGISVEQATAMLGKLADAGIRGSQAGTSLRRILTEMAKTGKPFKEAFEEIAKSGMSVSDAMDEVGRTAQTALLVLSESKEGVYGLTDALNQAGGSAQKMADEQLKSLAGQITLTQSAWEGFVLSLEKGDGFISKTLMKGLEGLRGTIATLQFSLGGQSQRDETRIANLAQEGSLKIRQTLTKDLVNIETNLLNVRRQIVAVETAVKRDPNNQSLKNELGLLKEREKTLNIQFSNESKQVAQKARSQAIELNATLKQFELEALQIEQRNRSLREELNSTGITARRRTEINNELEKNVEKHNKLNNTIKIGNATIKTLNEIYKGLLKETTNLNEVKEEETKKTDQNTASTKKNTEAKKTQQKEIQVALIGTVEWFEKLRSALQTEQKQVSQNSDQWNEYQAKIDQVNESIKKITESIKEVGVEISDFDLSDEGVSAAYDDLADLFNDPFQGGTDWKDSFMEWSNVALDAINIVEQALQSSFQNELNRLEKRKEVAIQFAGDSESARIEIEKQYEERRRQIMNRQAQQERRFAIINSIVNTAQAVVATLSRNPLPGGLALAAVVGAIGAAQTAIIASQPLPQFYKGTDNAPAGLAMTDERGAEIVTDKSGKIKSFGSEKPRLQMLDKGDKVFTAEKSKKMLFENELNSLLNDNNISPVSGALTTKLQPIIIGSGQDIRVLEKLDDIKRVISNKESVHFNVDNNGINTFVKRNGKTAQIMNNRIRGIGYGV